MVQLNFFKMVLHLSSDNTINKKLQCHIDEWLIIVGEYRQLACITEVNRFQRYAKIMGKTKCGPKIVP